MNGEELKNEGTATIAASGRVGRNVRPVAIRRDYGVLEFLPGYHDLPQGTKLYAIPEGWTLVPNEPQTEPAGGASELTEVLCLARRLRQCLRFDQATPEESEIEAVAREAACELDRMAEYTTALEAWKSEGEKILGNTGASAMFSLGDWWADRPWRNREA